MNDTTPTRNRLYLLPNLFTTAGLFASFYAIVAALKSDFELAVMGLIVAMIMDLFDGRIARMTQTQSEFGAQYDSLCDMVSFGIAPPLILYSWSLQHLGKVGWLAAFVYVSCTALRLARFNVGSSECTNHFQGLPCPPAAGFMICLVWNDFSAWLPAHDWFILALTILVAIMMVSNVRYWAFKQWELNVKGRLLLFFGLINVLLFTSIAADPPLVTLFFFTLYAVSGPMVTGYRYYQAWRLRRKRLGS